MFITRKATEQDRNFKAQLEALQVEQAGLNRRVKAQRERAQQITVEFYALKEQWNEQTGDTQFITIDWS